MSKRIAEPRSWPSLSVVLGAALLASCGAPSAPAGSGPAASTDRTTATATGRATVGPQAHVLEGAGLRSLADLAAIENELTARVAAAAGLAAFLGGETWTWAEQLLRDELAMGGQEVGLGGGPILLASVANPPLPPLRRTAIDGGGGVGLAMAASLVLTSLGDPARPPQDMNVDLDSTQDTTANGQRTVARVSGHIGTTVSGSNIEADVQIGVEVTVTDAATGAVVRTATFRSRGTIKLELCPDANGKVRGHVTLTVDGGTSGAGSASMSIDAEVEGTVGEDAYLQSVDVSGTTTQTSAGSGGASARRSVVSAGYTAAVGRTGIVDAAGATGQGQVVEESEALTDAEVTAAYRQIGQASGSAIWLLADKAQAQWRGGACVEIRATEQSRDVQKNETVQFEARPWQKVEGVELAKNIVADFSGKSSAEPLGAPIPSPILVSFKAGAATNDTGTITLTSTSNRGIGTLDITFRVKGGWIIDGASGGGRVHGQKCGAPPGPWTIDGTYTRAGFVGEQRWSITIAADERTGTFTYNTTQEGKPAGSPVTIYLVGRAQGTVTLAIDAVDGTAHMVLKETKHTYSATTSSGGTGSDQNAPLEQYTFDWETGGSC